MEDLEDFDDFLDAFAPPDRPRQVTLTEEQHRAFFLEVMTEAEGPTLERFEKAHRTFQDLVEQLRAFHDRNQIVDPDLMETTKMAQLDLAQAKMALDESFRRTQYRMDRLAVA